MPTHSGPAAVARLITVAALVFALVAAALSMFGAGGYELRLTTDSASQLVKGNQVKVGGVPVGTIKSIELAPDSRALLTLEITDDSLSPLHAGTKATIRATSLSGIANRYVALEPGPNNADPIEDGGEIPADDSQSAVDLDVVLNSLDPQTQRDLQRTVRSGSGLLNGRTRQANAGIEALNPALAQTAATAREIIRDREAFQRFVVESADVVSAVSSRPEDLEQLTGNALATLGALADRSSELDSSLGRLPPVLRRTNTTLVNLRTTLREARPLVREARPAARPLSQFLQLLGPVARRARPVVSDLRGTVRAPGEANDLLDALRGLPPTARAAVPAFRSATRTVRDAQPVVDDARPYTPDLVGGLLNGFGGSTSGYYDANGHYARISFQASVYSVTGAGSLAELPQLDGLAGYRNRVFKRCPGAATQPAPDRSNPYIDRPGFPCSREDDPR